MGQTSNNHHQKTRRTQLIFTFFLFFFSLMILLRFPLTFNSLQTTIPSVSLTSLHHTGSGLVITSRKIAPPTGPASARVVAQEKITPRPGPTQNGSSLDGVHPGSGRNKNGSCDIFDGRWVLDEQSDPVYPPGSCPFLDYTFNCFNNGRSDLGYLRYRWQPYGCDIPRFDGKRMLEMLRGKRMVFVGDSLNRNMWESLVCALRISIVDKRRVFEVSGRRQFRTEGFYAFRFKDYNCSIEFIRSPFLVQQWKLMKKQRGVKGEQQTLRLDMIQATTSKYNDADFLIFNTGHWWTHHKTKNGMNFFQEGGIVRRKMKVAEAFQKALQTWAKWVDKNVNKKKTKVFFVGYSSSHFRGGKWNSGGNCQGETEPITDDKFLAQYPWMMKTLESVISNLSTPVMYLNITKMTGYRKDGHPSIYGRPDTERRAELPQDCSHWCLPGVPDTWNQLLYTSLLHSFSNGSITTC